jgi:LPPG:FO 2-phospho-L-lactate transferase
VAAGAATLMVPREAARDWGVLRCRSPSEEPKPGGGFIDQQSPRPRLVLLTGGFGGARLVPRLADVLGPGRLTIIANVGDDLTWLGVRVCPDVDANLYAMAGLFDAARGWGRANDTFRTRDALVSMGVDAWFALGDADLAVHLLRTELLRSGRTLTDVTVELARRLGVKGATVLPASDEPSETHLRLADGRYVHFQEWYVRERARPDVRSVYLAGGPASPAALAALRDADAVVLGPSNPITSIGPILALSGIGEAVARVPLRVAVSPVVVRVDALDDAARPHTLARQRILASEECPDRPGAIAGRYRGLVDHFVLDRADAEEQADVRSVELQPVLAGLLDPVDLAQTLKDLTAPRNRGAASPAR